MADTHVLPGSGFCARCSKFLTVLPPGDPAARSAPPKAPEAPPPPREAGVRRPDGKYSPSSKGSVLDLWRGVNCKHDKPSPYAKLSWFGSVVWNADTLTKEKCYFGHGDHFFFSEGEEFKEGLCLGFAHKAGHPYGVLASVGDTETVVVVKLEDFRGLPKERKEPETDKAQRVLSAHLPPVSENPRTLSTCVLCSFFSQT